MENMLRIGAEVTSDSGSRYRVVSYLGSGGQGEVYEVSRDGKGYALKWYFETTATRMQREILNSLAAAGSPDPSFLWPEEMVSDGEGKTFGYIMPLRPKRFKGIVQMMKREAEPSFRALCRAAFNMTRSYEKLHKAGYAYRDISFGNVFLDPDNGDVMICDTDNVSPNDRREDTAVFGTPRFMAPEIVTGQALPSRNTDLYSLSVLLFCMFMLGHPLDGKKEADIHSLDPHAMFRLYGSEPVFVFDPEDASNRPVPGIHDNVLIYWKLYPRFFRELFIRAFTEGLRTPNRRITENEWMEAIANLMTGIIICPGCGAEVFYDEARVAAGEPHKCWRCARALQYPASLIVGKYRVLLGKDAVVPYNHIRDDHDMDRIAARVIRHPTDPKLWGLENRTGDNWTYIRADGRQITVMPGMKAGIIRGAKINFGPVTGEFK